MNPPNHQEAGEDMNVRIVHGALWRELAEPIEHWRRTPWYLRHFYAIMALLAIFYLVQQVFDWNEYEENRLRRFRRDQEQKALMESTPQSAP